MIWPSSIISPGPQQHGKDRFHEKEKYREMLLEAAETILGYFGFDRNPYGDSPKKNKEWWHEFGNWRVQDVENEIS